MLEILILISLTRKVGSMAEAKGHSPGSFKLYTVLLWFGGEVLGFIIGSDMYESSEADGFNMAAYGIALVGAAAGALTAYLIASNLSDKSAGPV